MSKENAKKFYEKFIGSEEMQNELKRWSCICCAHCQERIQ